MITPSHIPSSYGTERVMGSAIHWKWVDRSSINFHGFSHTSNEQKTLWKCPRDLIIDLISMTLVMKVIEEWMILRLNYSPAVLCGGVVRYVICSVAYSLFDRIVTPGPRKLDYTDLLFYTLFLKQTYIGLKS